MIDGYPKSFLIVAIGLSYAGLTCGLTEYGMQKSKQAPATNLGECFWKEMNKQRHSALTEKEMQDLVISKAKSCDHLFNN